VVLAIATLVSGIVAQWRPRALPVGRLALGVFYAVAGAMVHGLYLATGSSYAGFADAAHVSLVRTAWHFVVAPNQALFIGLLIAFEAAVGVLVLMGGRKAQLGMVGILGMQACLLLFGWFLTVSGRSCWLRSGSSSGRGCFTTEQQSVVAESPVSPGETGHSGTRAADLRL